MGKNLVSKCENSAIATPEPEQKNVDKVLEAKKRMLGWSNPVEYVNNMYGCHPDDNGSEYFEKVFGNL